MVVTQRKHSPETKRNVIRLRDAGLSYPKIAAETGLCTSVCHAINQSDRRDCLLAMDAADLRDAGMTVQQIAKKLGSSARHIRFVMKDRYIAPKKAPTVPFPLEPSIAGKLSLQAVELRKAGLNSRAIATRLGVSVTQVTPWTYGVAKAAIKKPKMRKHVDAAQAIAADDALLPPPIEEPAWTPEVVPAGDTAVAERRPYDVAAYRIPASEIVARHIDDYGIDSAQERWIDLEREQLLSMWRTVHQVRALDEAEAEAAAIVEKPSIWVRFLRFIGVR